MNDIAKLGLILLGIISILTILLFIIGAPPFWALAPIWIPLAVIVALLLYGTGATLTYELKKRREGENKKKFDPSKFMKMKR